MTVKTREPEKTEETHSGFEVIRKAADDYVSSGKRLYITAKDLCGSIVETGYMARLEMETYNPEFHEGIAARRACDAAPMSDWNKRRRP